MQLHQSVSIAMPNEIFIDLKNWVKTGDLKSIQHQEFAYSYYWLLAYLWRYSYYSEEKIGQPEIKKILGYNSNEKRLNYIIKKNGLLNEMSYTFPTSNYPVSWHMRTGEDVEFDMLNDFEYYDRELLTPNKSRNFFVQSPLKHLGDSENDGIYWNSSNTHILNSNIFTVCMSNSKLGCAGFYLYGLLVYIRDKSMSSVFHCANETLVTYTGWSLERIIRLTNELEKTSTLSKEQRVKTKGSVNEYNIF